MQHLKLTTGGLVAGVVATAAIATFVGGPAPASGGVAAGAGTAPPAAQDPDEAIVLVEEEVNFKFVDVGPKGESVGDYLLSRSSLHGPQGKRLGRVLTRCMLLPKPDLQCDGVYKLRGRGDIVFANVVDTAKEPPMLGALVGGDGDFKNITGQLALDFEDGEARTTLEIYYHD